MKLAINKVVRIGDAVFAKIRFDGKRLSITGVVAPTCDGDAKECGQINMSEWGIINYAQGWSVGLEKQFRQAWKDWHLNDMRAGSLDQRAWLKANPGPEKYDSACARLSAVGLNPDSDGYRYGSAWLFEPVPDDVLDFLASLPDTDIQPAWI